MTLTLPTFFRSLSVILEDERLRPPFGGFFCAAKGAAWPLITSARRESNDLGLSWQLPFF